MQETLLQPFGSTHSREIKLAARIIQKTNTPGFPMTLTKPVMKAEWGWNFCSIWASIGWLVGMERARRNFTPRKSIKTKLNNSIAALIYPRLKNEANPVKATAQ